MKHEKQALKYTPFSEMKEPGEYNCYGIIYDASFPQIQDQSQPGGIKYECTIKLIDQFINFINHSDLSSLNNNIITLIIKSQFKEKIPFIHTIGDIIRIHSGIYSHKNKKNLYLTINNNVKGFPIPNWCIFSGISSKNSDNSFIPILSSKKYYSIESQDEAIIKELRNFIKNNLSIPKSISFPMETALDKRIINKENDTTVQVNYKIELDDKIIYYVQDDTDICELQTNKYFDFIQVNDIIRIRSYRLNEKNILFTNQFSNILIIPKTLGYYKEFQDKIKEQKLFSNKEKKNKKNNNENTNNIDDDNEWLMNFDEYNKVNNLNTNSINSNYNNNKIIPLIEENEDNKENYNLLFNDNYSEENINENEEKKIKLSVIDFNNNKIKKFSENSKINEDKIIEVQLIKYHPKNLVNCIKYFCRKCKKISSIENDFKININSKFHCASCKYEYTPNFYYNMIFECVEKKNSNKIIILHLNTFDGEAESIFGVMPTNFNLESEQKRKLDNILRELIESKEYIKLKIRKTILNNKGIIYRIVGDYSNKI